MAKPKIDAERLARLYAEWLEGVICGIVGHLTETGLPLDLRKEFMESPEEPSDAVSFLLSFCESNRKQEPQKEPEEAYAEWLEGLLSCLTELVTRRGGGLPIELRRAFMESPENPKQAGCDIFNLWIDEGALTV